MLIGESRYFDLVPISGVPITDYEARYDIVSMGNIVKTGAVTNTGSKFEVRVQTDDLQPLTYDLRIMCTDLIDGQVQMIYRERMELTR